MEDIRFKQRLENFSLALMQLTSAVELFHERKLSDLEAQGMIQAFEFTHELAWNVMKDYFEYQGNATIMGSRDATREAFQKGLITEGNLWMEMIKSRNHSSHTYNQKIASEIVLKIVQEYHVLFLNFKNKMNTLKDQ